ncbi:SLC13 family permease [Roseofilum casamattae]|uniref:SLC13 family permease n=1 Tax=Roseofilum casamattae BLCC-M143 TaxID=3022442 RepID=A0ABT7BYS8_9CYAN|nr:SLC13 family permease [Roseofilum casamattae]MDJ1184353.1 SLC13 family permease [Roseofilum casamattae BLCC-M143]
MSILLTLSVVVLALVCFITEWLPVDITALSIAILLMVLGLVTPEEGISGFSNSATITVMAMFILSAGITKTGVIQIVRNWMVRWGGNHPTQQIFVMASIVGPISALINNTAIVAIFLPIIEEWSKRKNTAVSQLLIPLSFASILGGLVTLVGTSTNILASGISAQLGYGEFTIFQFSRMGVLVFLIGLAYLSVVAPFFLPKKRHDPNNLMAEDYNLKDYVSEVIVSPRSSLIGQSLNQSGIQRTFDLDVLDILRNKQRFPQPLSDKVLNAGDILIIRSSKEDLLNIREEKGLDILPDVKFQQEPLENVLSSGEEKIAEVLILSNSRLIGTTLKDLRFRQRYNVTVLAIRRGSELVKGRLGRIPLRFGDLLLVQGPKQSFVGLQTTRELLVLEQKEVENLRQDKAAIALSIIASVVLVAAFGWMPILVSALAGVILMVMTGCLKPGEIYGAVRWDVIFLLAGLIPLGIAMNKSGATQWLAEGLIYVGGNLSGYWLLLFFFVITSILTEVLSNNASVVLMLPIAVEVAKTLGLNPYAFMYAVVFAASNSFMTPIGYQTNAMVYSPGGYKFFDFTRVGAPLSLLMMIAVPLLITWIYGL